jgi:hypothetical protein
MHVYFINKGKKSFNPRQDPTCNAWNNCNQGGHSISKKPSNDQVFDPVCSKQIPSYHTCSHVIGSKVPCSCTNVDSMSIRICSNCLDW